MKKSDFKSIEGYEGVIERIKVNKNCEKVECGTWPFSHMNATDKQPCYTHNYDDNHYNSAIEFEKMIKGDKMDNIEQHLISGNKIKELDRESELFKEIKSRDIRIDKKNEEIKWLKRIITKLVE